MKKHIHIHLPPKKPEVAYLLRAKVKDSAKLIVRNTGPDKWHVFKEGYPVAEAGPFKTAAEAAEWIKSRTKDSPITDLQSKRDKLEAEFDKADDSGDNRAMERIRKELAALDKQIEAEKKKEKATTDAVKEYSVKLDDGSRVVVSAASPENAKERAEAKTGKKAVGVVPRQSFGSNKSTTDAGLGKLIKTLTSDRTMVKVYFDAEWEEYIARLYYKFAQGWVEKTEASYHTDDKEDALSTASDMFRRAESRTKDAEFSTFPSLYKTARDPKSGSVYKVIGQNNKSKEASTHLLLKMPHGNSWWEVNKVEPVL